MQKLAEICIDRPVFATVLILTLVVVGAFGYTTLGLDRLVPFPAPVVTISVTRLRELQYALDKAMIACKRAATRSRHGSSMAPRVRASRGRCARSGWPRRWRPTGAR